MKSRLIIKRVLWATMIGSFLVILAPMIMAQPGVAGPASSTATELESLKKLLMNPYASLLWGFLGVLFQISSKPVSEKLWGIAEWIKANQKTFVTQIVGWLALWAVWASGALGSFFPTQMGPICFFMGMSTNTGIDHLSGQIQARMQEKTVTL